MLKPALSLIKSVPSAPRYSFFYGLISPDMDHRKGFQEHRYLMVAKLDLVPNLRQRLNLVRCQFKTRIVPVLCQSISHDLVR